MKERIQASMRTRQSLPVLLEGRLSSPNARADRRRMDALRRELDQNYEAESGLCQPSADMRPNKLSGIYET